MSAGWEHTGSGRLLLDIPTEVDVDDLFVIHSDLDTWRHLPSGRHTDRARSTAMVAESGQQFARHGLGYWSLRVAADGPDGPVVGRGGCAVPSREDGVELPWWNLYYRLAPAVHRRGYAAEMSRRAIEAAHDVDPVRPVLAFLVEHNEGSRRTAEAAGLQLVWRGPDRGNPDPTAVRLVYLDREPDDALREVFAREF